MWGQFGLGGGGGVVFGRGSERRGSGQEDAGRFRFRRFRKSRKGSASVYLQWNLDSSAMALMYSWLVETVALWSKILAARDHLGELANDLPSGEVWGDYTFHTIKKFLEPLSQWGEKVVQVATLRSKKEWGTWAINMCEGGKTCS